MRTLREEGVKVNLVESVCIYNRNIFQKNQSKYDFSKKGKIYVD